MKIRPPLLLVVCGGAFLLLFSNYLVGSNFSEMGTEGPVNGGELVEAPSWADELDEEFVPHLAKGDQLFPVSDDSNVLNSAFTGTKWTNNIVYYQFNANVNATNRQRFRDAAAEWAAVANLTFVEGAGSGNYIMVQDGTGNSSYVGMIGGAQALTMYN